MPDDFAELLADATAEAERAGAAAAEPAPAAEAEPKPAAEPVADEPAEPAEPAAAGPAADLEPKPAEPAIEGDQEPWYKKRIDTLTHRRDEALAARAAAEARTATLEALLAASGKPLEPVDPNAPPAAPSTPAPKVFTQADVAAAAAKIAAETAFNAQCNTIFDDGVKTFGADFQKAVGNLNTAGLISNDDPTFLRAIMETDTPALLLNHFGKDPAQAEKLLNMSPIKMGAELARMSDRLAKPATPAPLSKAPAPIDPIGAARPRDQVDLADSNTPDSDFFAEFEKQLARR